MTAVPTTAQEPSAFSPKVILALIAVALICFAAFMVLSAGAKDERSLGGGQGAASRSAVGFSGAVTLLRATGLEVSVGRPPARGYPRGTLVIVTPSADDAPLKQADVAYGEGVVVLVVLPKWQTRPDRRGDRVLKAGLIPTGTLAAMVREFGPLTVVRGRGKAAPPPPGATPETFYAVDIDRPQALVGAGWSALLEEPDLGAVVAAAPVRGVVVLADPDMRNNHGLAHRENARGALSMIHGLTGEGAGVAFPVGRAGAGAALSMALRPPLLGATLCAVLAALLIGAQALARFGPTAREGRAYGAGARGLVDNSAALVRMARKEHLLAPAYAAMIEADVARAAGAERMAGDERLQRLERLGQRRGAHDSIKDLAAAAAAARNRADLLAVARRLHEWKREMTREAR